MAEKLEFDLLVKQNELSKTLKDASSQANTLSSKIKALSDEINKTNFKGISDSAKQAGESVGVASDFMEQFKFQTIGVAAGQFAFSILTSAINLAKSAITDSIAAYAESEAAINKLNQSLNLTGSYSASSSDDLQAFSKELQATSVYSDEAALSQITYAKSLGLSNEQAKQLAQASVNLSAQLGGSLEENTNKLVKAMSGELPRAIKNLIPDLKNLTQEQLRAGAASELINKNFSGAASAELNTYNGKVASLKNSFNDLQESLGELIVKSSPYQSFLKSSKASIDSFNGALKGTSIATSLVSGEYGLLTKTSTQLSGDIKFLNDRIKFLKEDLKTEEKDRSFWDKIIGGAAASQVQVAFLTSSLKTLQDRLASGKAPSATEDKGRSLGLTAEQEEALSKTKNTIIRVEQDIASEKKRIIDNYATSAMTEEEGRREAEIASILEFETRKASIDAELKEKELSAKLSKQEKDAEIIRIGKEKELAILQASGKSQAAIADESDKKEKTRKQQAAAFELQTLNTRAQYISAFGNLGAALAADGSRAQFIIQKSAAIAGSIVATQLAAAQALAVFPSPNLALAATATTIGNINTAAIVATAIKGFEQGGFVGGLNGASVGADNRVAQVRDGEMILNATQQKNLMDMINAGGGGGDIVIQINEREIARAVRNQTMQGFRLA